MKVRVLILATATLLGAFAPTLRADAIMYVGPDPTELIDLPSVPGLPQPDACVYAPGNRPTACLQVVHDGDGVPDAKACLYDQALMWLWPWWNGGQLACGYTTTDWGFVDGPGLCMDVTQGYKPFACVNGHSACTLKVIGVYILCDQQH